MKVNIEPAILYFGTPVVLISTLNEDGTTNIAPISAIWWLGWSATIGLDGTSKTTENLKRDGRCIVNLPSAELAEQVNKLALLTGSREVPLHKKLLGYRYSKNKFIDSGFSQTSDANGSIGLVEECPIHLSAEVVSVNDFAKYDERMAVPAYAIELKINSIEASKDILLEGSCHKIDPNKWNPLVMSFRKLYGLSSELHESRLAIKSENLYAPWKRKGMVKYLSDKLLTRSNRKYGH